MKTFFYIIVGLVIVVSIYFVWLSVSSRKQPNLGMFNEQLLVCTLTSNCVSSERQNSATYIEPLKILATKDWPNVKKIIIEFGGEIVSEESGYLHARFVTPLMRYVDDVELRFDDSKKVIHIRSASRVGRSDFGVNRARVEKIRAAFLLSQRKAEKLGSKGS